MTISLARVYEALNPRLGRRLLIDRLWPRGLSKNKAAIDYWYKDVAPSQELRLWFRHDPKRFAEFRLRYLEELRGRPSAAQAVLEEAYAGDIVLLYAAHDPAHNNAVVLRDHLQSLLQK